MRRMRPGLLALALLLLALPVAAQTMEPARFALPLTDPGEPVNLKVSVLSGSITVEPGGSDEVEVIVERKTKKRSSDVGENGMKRIPKMGAGLKAQEIDNNVVVRSSSNSYVRLRILTPRRTSTVISLTNGGGIEVSGLTGDHEIKNVNGGISALDMSGSVVANTTNGSVIVTFDDIEPDKPMAFQSWNGRVDVTFPGDLDANVRLDTNQGEIYSDFDVDVDRRPMSSESGRDGRGRYTIELSGEVRGTVGSGGPLMHFKTYNGSIYLRKAR